MQPPRRSNRRSSLDRSEDPTLAAQNAARMGQPFPDNDQLGLRAQGGPLVDGGRNERAVFCRCPNSTEERSSGMRGAVYNSGIPNITPDIIHISVNRTSPAGLT